MTKSLRDYITETEATQDRPITGDQFAINIREECLLETAVAEVTEDGVVLEADERFVEILESYGMLAEDSREAVRNAISRRIMSQHADLLTRHGIDRVMAAIDDAADYYGSDDLDEIGSSDVSAFVKSVIQDLEGREPVSELSPGRVEQYARAAQRDMARHAAAAKVKRSVRGADDQEAQAHDLEADRRERGLDRAQRRMNEQDASMNTAERVAQALASRGVTYSRDQEDEIIDMIAYQLHGMNMPSKVVRHLISYDQDFVSDVLSGLPRRDVAEGAMKDIDIEYQDWKQMSPREFFDAYKMTKDAWYAQHRKLLQTNEAYQMDELRRRSGMSCAEGDISQLEKDIADAPVKPIASMEGSCGSMREVLDRLKEMDNDDVEAARASRAKLDKPAMFRKQERFVPGSGDQWRATLQDLEQAQDLHRREFAARKKASELDEAEYQGRNVALGKPMQGDVKKFKVYVKDPKTGNVKKVNFGDPNMRIKKSNPARRRSFRARHNCANPGPRTKARYWSCRAW
jgi:hypothetical protein